MANMTDCFHCQGSGRILGRPNYGYDADLGGCRTGPPREFHCRTCEGSGRVTWDQVEAWHYGALIRGWRAAKMMLLGDMADALGLKPSELSAYETGEKPWPADVRARVNEFVSQPH